MEKSGSWFSYHGERIGQGREKVCKFLEENPDILQAVETEVRERSKDIKFEEETAYISDDEADDDSITDIDVLLNE